MYLVYCILYLVYIQTSDIFKSYKAIESFSDLMQPISLHSNRLKIFPAILTFYIDKSIQFNLIKGCYYNGAGILINCYI